MMLIQKLLCAEAASRFQAARPELAPRFDLDSVSGLLAAKEAAALSAPDFQVQTVVVMNRFDLASWIRATCGFVLGVTPEHAAVWRRSLTRTIFLAGNPGNLRDRFSFDCVTGPYAWAGPAPVESTATLCRLLKMFHAPNDLPAAQPSVRLDVPVVTGRLARPPRHRDLEVATAGVSVSMALVHLNHLLAEAVMDGHLGCGDRLTVRMVPQVIVTAPFVALRVDTDRRNPDRLRAYARLANGSPGSET